MRTICTTCLPLVALLVLAPAADAQIWAEVGDAGPLPASAQVPSGPGPSLSLTVITGTISSFTDVDMYMFRITGGGTFSATTVGQPGTLLDTELFLFNSGGVGVYGNDDAVGSVTPRSTLPAGHPLTPTQPGIYFLAIAPFFSDPFSSGGTVFPLLPFRAVKEPAGPGGGQPVIGFNFVNIAPNTGTYTIALTGAEFVPEPGSLVLLGTGALGLLAYGWRRRKAAGTWQSGDAARPPVA
jgi:hypothetical protein